MFRTPIIAVVFSILFITGPLYIVKGGPVGTPQYKSQEVSEEDGIPVLIKHLPNWESIRSRTTLARDTATLKTALGQRPILDIIDFTAGTEAVTAPYDSGKLLIVEFSSPQVSLEEDAKFTAVLAEKNDSGLNAYRRVGNYSVFVFDASDDQAANALVDQVKYEKSVTWLGKDPNILHRAERAFVISTTNLFISTVLIVLIGIGFSLFSGVLVGYVFLRIRERHRASWTTFSDAGGLTRLNLDGLTPEISPNRLLDR